MLEDVINRYLDIYRYLDINGHEERYLFAKQMLSRVHLRKQAWSRVGIVFDNLYGIEASFQPWVWVLASFRYASSESMCIGSLQVLSVLTKGRYGVRKTLLIGVKIALIPTKQQETWERYVDGRLRWGSLREDIRVIHYQMHQEVLFRRHVLPRVYCRCFMILRGIKASCPSYASLTERESALNNVF